MIKVIYYLFFIVSFIMNFSINIHSKTACINNDIYDRKFVDICDENGEPLFGFTGMRELYEMVGKFEKDVVPAMRNGKWGLIKDIGEPTYYKSCVGKCHSLSYGRRYFIILPFKYDFIDYCNDKYCTAVNKNKWGIIDFEDKKVIDFSYDYLEFSGKIILAAKNGKYGFINLQNIEVIPFKYNRAEIFAYGMAAVYLKGKCGYIMEDGKTAIPMYYDFCYTFTDGFAAVKKSDKWGYINKDNKAVIPFIFEKANPFYDKIATVKEKGKWYIINSTGSKIKEIDADDIDPFYNGVARFKKSSRYGFINTSGEKIFDAVFDSVEEFKKYTTTGKINQRNVMVDIFGRIRLIDFDKTKKYGNLIMVWKNEKAGIVDNNFRTILEPEFDKIDQISEDRFIVKKDSKYGLIDISAKYIINPEFDNMEAETNQPRILIKVEKDHKQGVVDINGKIVLPYEYEEIVISSDHIVIKKTNYGIAQRDGKIIMDTISESYPGYYDGIIKFKKNGRYGLFSIEENSEKISPEYSEINIFSDMQIEAKKDDGSRICFSTKDFSRIKCIF